MTEIQRKSLILNFRLSQYQIFFSGNSPDVSQSLKSLICCQFVEIFIRQRAFYGT
jgi:hypothetical protein